MNEFHVPALLKKVTSFLEVSPGRKYIDTTIGGGGHSWEILKRGGVVLGLDVDPEAIRATKEKLESRGWKLEKEVRNWKFDSLTSDLKHFIPASDFSYPTSEIFLVRTNFVNVAGAAKKLDFTDVDGILFDLGVSAHQLAVSKRGFSFESDFPLDMRMDPDLCVTAADLVNGLNKGELYELFSKLGEEHLARPIAEAITGARSLKPIETSRELAEIIIKVRRHRRWKKIHPATRCFQALRLAVNDELNNLKKGLPSAAKLLRIQGRLVVISFQSLEDRIVKHFLRRDSRLKVLTKKPIRPSLEEIEENPRSRSARMRVASKIANE